MAFGHRSFEWHLAIFSDEKWEGIYLTVYQCLLQKDTLCLNTVIKHGRFW